MSLQRRLIVYLVVCAPLIWMVALVVSAQRARHEVNELFDTGLVRLARQLQVIAGATTTGDPQLLSDPPGEGTREAGDSDVQDLAMAIWNRDGHMLVADRAGVELPYRRDTNGFLDVKIGGDGWRIYYLHPATGEWQIAVD